MVLIRGLGSKAHTARVKHSVSCGPSCSPPTPLDCQLGSAAQLFQGSAWECVREGWCLRGTLALQMPTREFTWPCSCARGWQIHTSHLSRINLADSEPSLVQAAPGQAVQLFCPGNIPPEFQAGWQKEGWPISSNRCV